MNVMPHGGRVLLWIKHMAFTNAVLSVTAQGVLTTNYGTLSPQLQATVRLLLGTGNNQGNCEYYSDFSVTSGTPLVLDLIGGGLLQPDGSAFNPTAIKIMLIQNRDSTNNLIVGNASNPFSSWLGGTAQTLTVQPGGIFPLGAPLAGYAVTSTTDRLQIAASAGTVAGTIIIAGVQ